MYKTGMKLQTSWNSLGKIRDGEKKVKEKKDALLKQGLEQGALRP